MPRNLPRDFVEFCGRIDRDLYREWLDVMPINGANSWFIRTAVAYFVENMKANPGVAENLQLAVNRLINETLAQRRA